MDSVLISSCLPSAFRHQFITTATQMRPHNAPIQEPMWGHRGDIEGRGALVVYGGHMADRLPHRTLNDALIRLREDAGLSQQELANGLNNLAASAYDQRPNLTKKTVGRWERGEVDWPQPFYRRLLAEYFKVAVDELGFYRPHRSTGAPVGGDDILTLIADPSNSDPRVGKDQQSWRDTRTALGKNRRTLAVLAEQLYPQSRIAGLENTGVITHPSWIPHTPVPLTRVSLVLDPLAPEPLITGGERESAPVRPLASAEHRYRRYHHAIRDLTPPRLFENRLCFRLMDLDWSVPTMKMKFGQMGFFDSIDTNEVLAHETALYHLFRDRHGEFRTSKPSWRRLAFRKLVDDPFDLTRRPLMGAIGTLTIRSGESPSVVLHHRDGDRVAGGGGMAHLLPAGIFQPSSVIPSAVVEDFSIWRNIQREYAEELLGHDEYDGSGRPITYADLEPFVTMDRALTAGDIRVWFLGLTLDALTLCGDILTVAVIEPELYDDLFADAVNTNAEGSVLARALPFEAHTIQRLRELGQLSPGATAALHFAWQHRATLLHE